MRRVNWVTNTCHFVPGIRSAYGQSNFWVRSNEITAGARAQALEKALSQLRCVTYRPTETYLDKTVWSPTSTGMLEKPTLKPSSPSYEVKCPLPIARDFLLFAAIDYHVMSEWEVQIYTKELLVFSTKDMPPSSVVDVKNEEEAIQVVAAQMVRRPHSQSSLRGMAMKKNEDENGPYVLDLDTLNRNVPVCSIDFHSYAPDGHKISATLSELARSYFRVVTYLKTSTLSNGIELSGQIAHIEVDQTLWIAILGGAILDTGRVTFQNLPGRWGSKNKSADEFFLERVDSVIQQLEPYGGTSTEFSSLVFSSGTERGSAIPFFIAGLFGQIVVCYFLSVGTSAGIWTSVAFANSLYVGRLTDWHSVYYGKRGINSQPGMKMSIPGSPSKDLMIIATFDRSTPKEGNLRPGFLMNAMGLIAAVLGAIFSDQTRQALGFAPSQPTHAWVVYTTVVLCIGTTLMVTSMLLVQYLHEKTWRNNSELPTRWMAQSTFPCSIAVCVLAVVFKLKGWAHLWPILDVITWLSGAPLGIIENGRFFSADDNMLHLVLLNRWMMGAVASALGST